MLHPSIRILQPLLQPSIRSSACFVVMCLTAAVCAPAWGQCAVVEQTKLVAFDGATNDIFGSSVAIDGDVAVIGAPWDDDAGGQSGAAYVYRNDGVSWNFELKLTAFDGVAGDEYGAAVSVSGSTIAVGAKFSDVNGINTGAVYVYVFDGVSWVLEAKLSPTGLFWEDQFGHAVSVSGDLLLGGARLDDQFGASSGAAYVYTRTGTTWTQTAKLTALDAAPIDWFGTSVSISTSPTHGPTAFVGSIFDDDAGSMSGSAYVFRPVGGNWVQTAKLTATDAAAGDFFGGQVSLSGDVAVISANQDDNAGGVNAGAAYVFRYNGFSWVEESKLLAADAATDEWFGQSVSISGERIAVGSVNDNTALLLGAAYVFGNSGGGWVQQFKLTASDATAGDQLGNYVALDSQNVIVGAFFDDAPSADSGSAYILGLNDCNTNGNPDACDIALGTSADTNGNGIPDECETPPCLADITPPGGNGVVNIDDLVAVLNGFGPCKIPGNCPADITPAGGNGVVNIDDLVAVLNAFGACP